MKKIITLLFLLTFTNIAYAGSGTIDATYHTAQLCENVGCTVTSTSPINFGYFASTPSSNITVGDSSLTGYMWGSSIGYVVLKCSQTTSGCSSTNGNFKVTNTNGTLSGYGWGTTTGWVNFGPFANGSSPIIINSNGQMNGYAWAQNFGWIKFDCTDASYCVKTSWRATSSGGSFFPTKVMIPNPTVTPEITPNIPKKHIPKTEPTSPPSIQDFPIAPPQISNSNNGSSSSFVKQSSNNTEEQNNKKTEPKGSFWSFVKHAKDKIGDLSLFAENNKFVTDLVLKKPIASLVILTLIVIVGLYLIIKRKL